jgi:superfamily II DNA or RNA helicase
MNPGTIVRCRNRDWVLLPGDDQVYRLRPLAGTSDDVVVVHRELANLIGYELPEERVQPSTFPLPNDQDVRDAASAHLLWQAARLTLREGATPFRSLGRISIRPRVYQFVPLLMALRLDPVRLFIADDVGVGKTIEALLVARELFDRSEIRRFCVLCPPYLCDQWEQELRDKFNFEPVVIRSGAVGALERSVPAGKSIYEHFSCQVISIDWVKSDRNKHQFLQFCPDMVIVDEAHGAAEASARSAGQQERHHLLRQIAQDAQRHLILLTATPHSGIEEAFRSLLGLLKPEFRDWNLARLEESQRVALARHFVQRTRRDIEQGWESGPCFPLRETADETYQLSPRYRQLFEQTYAFCSEIVRTGEQLEARRRRVRSWAALALLRCVMSSPAAAFAALESRARGLADDELAPDFAPFVFESADDRTDDELPTPPIEAAETTLLEDERRRLRALARRAEQICNPQDDTKLARCAAVVQGLLKEGFYPIVWCRYVATAEYVGEYLRQAVSGERVADAIFPEGVQVVVITGRMGDEERRVKIDQIDAGQPRVLVATDCLSEGINLQDTFNAVLHYDLPWNPNRLEQREGRVDRYGQTAARVRAIRFYGRDNPVDGAVIEVLLDKAREIHRTLGTHVPVPAESESVMEAVLNALFLRRAQLDSPQQLWLFEMEDVTALHQRWDLDVQREMEDVTALHRRWDLDVQREKESRTRFAQRALKPDEVQRELEATDSVLGDPNAVRDFVLTAAQRLALPITPDRRRPDVFHISLAPETLVTLPEPVRLALPNRSPLPARRSPVWSISFTSPTPEGTEYLGRNHRFVAALARFLMEQALTGHDQAIAARCGALRTRAVARLTTLLLLRVRYLLEQPQRAPLLAEEVLVCGYCDHPPEWLSQDEALRLLAEAQPDANLPLAEKQELVRAALAELGEWEMAGGEWGGGHPIQQGLRQQVQARAAALAESHKRIRKAVDARVRGLEVKPHLPPDLLGLLILQPMVAP